jgi:hypothetical protein
MSRAARLAAAAALLLTLALPSVAEADVGQCSNVAYGSAIDFDGERQRLALDLYAQGGGAARGRL